MTDPRIESLARLAVEVGANVQADQVVSVSGRPGQEELVHAVVAAAYDRGARFVDVGWFDPRVKLARLRHAAEDTLDWVPPWYGARIVEIGRMAGATIALAGPTAPGLFDDIDPARAGKDRLPSVREGVAVIMGGQVNWTVVPCPNPAWAGVVFPDLAPADALERLWVEIAHICRLDEPDPAAAWRARGAELEASARAAQRAPPLGAPLRRAGHRPHGGAPRRARAGWAEATTAPTACRTCPTSPPRRCSRPPTPRAPRAWCAATRPLDLAGTVVNGLEVRFEGGRAVEITADTGADILRSRAALDEGAARLGEVALVDGSGRIGPLGTVFFDTLLDENAASHIALGAGYPKGADPAEAERINTSEIHIDFMIGGPGGDGLRGGRRRQRDAGARESDLVVRPRAVGRRPPGPRPR